MTDEIMDTVARYKSRMAYCAITNRKCYAASVRSNKPTPYNEKRICCSRCPWEMKWKKTERRTNI